MVFWSVSPFENMLFVQASTNATDDLIYSLLPSADFDSSEVLVPLKRIHFLVKNGPFGFGRAPSQSQKKHFYEKTKLKR